MGHRLQTVFATAEGEGEYIDRLRDLIEAGQLHAAETLLLRDLQALETPLAQQCLVTKRDHVTISGWPELVEAIELHEGAPITMVAIGMGNEPDLAFESEELHAPFLTLGIYADGLLALSDASRDVLLSQCKSENPAWANSEEDIEVYLELDGLAPINTALIKHKHRFFFRDETTGDAPLLYVESVLAGWFRALRFHQAIAAEIDAHGLPGDAPVISGIFGMTPDTPTVHYPEKRERKAASEMAPLVLAPRPKRVEAMVDLSGTSIRRNIAAETIRVQAANDEAPVRKGFFARLFGR